MSRAIVSMIEAMERAGCDPSVILAAVKEFAGQGSASQREGTRARVAKHREAQKGSDVTVVTRNGCNALHDDERADFEPDSESGNGGNALQALHPSPLSSPLSSPSDSPNSPPYNPPNLEKNKAKKHALVLVEGGIPELEGYPIPFTSQRFQDSLSEWVTFRRENGKTLKPTTVKYQFKKFINWGEARSIAAIGNSIEQGWTGLFEPKTQPDVSDDDFLFGGGS